MAKKQLTTSFQPDPVVLPLLKEWAAGEDRSVSYMVNLSVREALEKRGYVKPKDKPKKST